MTSLPSKAEMLALIKQELASFPSDEKEFIESRLISLQSKSLKWEYGQNEPHESWVFADFKEHGVGAAYCKGGFGAMGSPWGLVFFHDDNFGMDCGWYKSLLSLIQDWVESGS